MVLRKEKVYAARELPSGSQHIWLWSLLGAGEFFALILTLRNPQFVSECYP